MLNAHTAPALHTVLHSFPLEKAQAQHCCHMFIPAQHHSFTCSVLHQHPVQRAGRLGSEGGQDSAWLLNNGHTPDNRSQESLFTSQKITPSLLFCPHPILDRIFPLLFVV